MARDDSGRWSALWVAARNGEGELRFYVDLPYETHAQRIEAWPKEGLYIERLNIHASLDAAPMATAIWRKKLDESGDEVEVSVETRAGRTYGDLHPGMAQADLRLEFLNPKLPNRFAMYERALSYLHEAAKEKPGTEKNTKTFYAARYQVHSAQFQAALTTLEGLKLPNSPQISEYRALALLLSGRIDDAAKEIAHFQSLKTTQDAKLKDAALHQLEMVLALRQGNLDAAAFELAAINKIASTKDFASHDLLVHALALYASQAAPDAESNMADLRRQAIQSLRELLLRRETKLPEELVEHVQFDSLRDDPAFAKLLKELEVDRRFVAVFSDRPEITTRQLFGLPPAQHDAAAREMRNNGFLPRIIGASPTTGGEDGQVSSVWEKPTPNFTQYQLVAHKIANLSLLLAALGDTGPLKAVLADELGIEARSWAIEGAPVVVPVANAIGLLRETGSDAARRNALRLVGTYDSSAPADDDRRAVNEQTARPFSEAGVQMASQWLRQRWGLPGQTSSFPNDKGDGRQNWYQNSQGQTMVVLNLNEPALMGSARNDPERFADSERQHWVRVGRKIAIASTETTVRQFEDFLADPKVKAYYASKVFRSSKQTYAPSADCPQISVRWYDAARYCQWLSEKEGLPKSEWCFPGIWELEDGATLQLPPDIAKRRGYRMPTEAEMELACRGGCNDSRPFGSSPALLAGYAWYSANSRGRTHAVGLLKPNDFGLFDVLGNVNEWCLDEYQPYRAPFKAMDDDEIDSSVKPELPRVLRGGSFTHAAKDQRSANRIRTVPARENSLTVGFRIARTESSDDSHN
jgi:formylglycine-generating enzyme required for sulfatase activity